MVEAANIPSNIRRYVAGFVLRRRRTALLRQLGIAITFAMVWLLAWSLLDRFLPLLDSVRAMLLACNIMVVIWLTSRPIAAILSSDFDWCAAAAQIEQRDPRFIGKLETAVSQLLFPAKLRGSEPMVRRIVEQAESLAGQKLALPLVPMEPALRPWLMALAIALLMTAMAFSAWLDLPHLLQRQLQPLGDFPPVTTTRISVETGNTDIPQGESLTITSGAQRLASDDLTIHLLSSDGNSQSAQSMVLDAQGKFSFVLNSVDHDWQYRISGGDAQSPLYNIHVLRRPAIADFQVRYNYPLYTGLPPTVAQSHDGSLQAPIGTQAIADLVSTEPLQSAAILIDGKRFTARATKQPNTYEVSIPISQTTPYQLELRNMRGVTNTSTDSKTNLLIHAIADQPPQLRWEFSATNLFVIAQGVVTLPYRVTDDYGAGSIALVISSAKQPPRRIPVADLGGLQKDQFGHAMLNLADLGIQNGDLLTAKLSAIDAIKQEGLSPPINLIIAPHSIDAEDQLRIAALNSAVALAQSLEDVSADAMRSQEDSQRSGNPDPAPRNSRMIRASVLSDQIAENLTRAVVHTRSSQPAAGLIALVDSATVLQIHSRPLVPNDDPSAAQIEHDTLARNLNESHTLRTQLETLRDGEVAALATNALENFSALLPLTGIRDDSQSAALHEALQQAGRDVDDQLKAIGIDPDDAELEDGLAAKAAAKDDLLNQIAPDSDPATRLLKSATSGAIPREEAITRLRAVARAEVIRPDADFSAAAALTQAAGESDSPSQQIESLAIRQAAQIAANDLTAATETDRQLHAIATSKPSSDAETLLPAIDRAAEVALAQAKTIAATQDAQKIKLANQQAARLRIESIPQIAGLLQPSTEFAAGFAGSWPQVAAERGSATQPAEALPSMVGFDESLGIYFGALRRSH